MVTKKKRFFKLGEKVKEIDTKGPGDQQGLIIEKLYIKDKIIEISNITNNRFAEDIIGDKEFIDIDLIQNNNQFRIPLEFQLRKVILSKFLFFLIQEQLDL
jgi:hypothetical protein